MELPALKQLLIWWCQYGITVLLAVFVGGAAVLAVIRFSGGRAVWLRCGKGLPSLGPL